MRTLYVYVYGRTIRISKWHKITDRFRFAIKWANVSTTFVMNNTWTQSDSKLRHHSYNYYHMHALFYYMFQSEFKIQLRKLTFKNIIPYITCHMHVLRMCNAVIFYRSNPSGTNDKFKFKLEIFYLTGNEMKKVICWAFFYHPNENFF